MKKGNDKNTKITCSACGTSPVNHKVLFFYNLLNEISSGFSHNFFNFKTSKIITNYAESFVQYILLIIGFVSFSDDMSKASTGRSLLIWEEANRRGIKMQQIVIWGKYKWKDLLF